MTGQWASWFFSSALFKSHWVNSTYLIFTDVIEIDLQCMESSISVLTSSKLLYLNSFKLLRCIPVCPSQNISINKISASLNCVILDNLWYRASFWIFTYLWIWKHQITQLIVKKICDHFFEHFSFLVRTKFDQFTWSIRELNVDE